MLEKLVHSPCRGRRALLLGGECRERDLPGLALDDDDARLALPALLPGRPVPLELDGPVHAHELHLTERLAHGLGIGLARELDPRRRRRDAVMATEALG